MWSDRAHAVFSQGKDGGTEMVVSPATPPKREGNHTSLQRGGLVDFFPGGTHFQVSAHVSVPPSRIIVQEIDHLALVPVLYIGGAVWETSASHSVHAIPPSTSLGRLSLYLARKQCHS